MDPNAELDRVEALFETNSDESAIQALSKLVELTDAENVGWQVFFGLRDPVTAYTQNSLEIVGRELVPRIVAQLHTHGEGLHQQKALAALKVLTALKIYRSLEDTDDGTFPLTVFEYFFHRSWVCRYLEIGL